jgi:acetylornithine deacetylase/succinyl-diaminopimelate desuccinylase-like protein
MELIKKLIQIPSLSGKEEEVKDFLIKLCQKESLPISVAGENLVVKFGNKRKKLIIFNAHMDTVLPGDLSKWKYPPFGPNSGKEARGKIYGLGASDEKASVVALLLLAKELKNRALPLDVWLTFVVKEETDGSGTQSFLQLFSKEISKYREVAAIICEPTGLKEIQIGHKGNAFLKITTFGDSGHGSEPEKIKKHAIGKMFEVKQKMAEIAKDLQELHGHKILGKPTIGLTSISAGDLETPNKFPDSCSATFDVRTIPEIHYKVLNLVKQKLGREIKVDYIYPPCPCGLTLKCEKIVKMAREVLSEAQITVSNSACDLCFFSQAGIPGIVLGPGEKNVAHRPNEFCYLSKIGEAVQVYKKIIDLW